jgi:hypothetical protein
MQNPKSFVWPLAAVFLLLSAPLFAAFPAGADQFASATPISFVTGISESTDLTAFGVEPSEPPHHPNLGGPYHSAWWKWTATAPGFCTIDTLLTGFDPDGANDTAIAVYTGTSLGSLVQLAQNDDKYDTGLSQVAFYAQPGVTYFIAVDCTPDFPGPVRLRLRQLIQQNAEWNGVIQPPTSSGVFPGAISLKTMRTGLLTGSLTIGAKKYPFKGAWALDGYFRATFPQLSKTGDLAGPPIDLMIDGAETGLGLLARVNDRNDSISGPLPRVSSFTAQTPSPERGNYNLFIVDNTAIGSGGIRLSVSPFGRVKGAGFLGDGQPVGFGSRLTEPAFFEGVRQLGVHAPLFAGEGFLNGFFCCTPEDTRASGMYYRRPANPTSSFYSTGFQMVIEAYGSLYTPPPPGQRVLGLLDPSGFGSMFVADAPGEISFFTEYVTLGTNNKFLFANPALRRPVLKIAKATGLITGSVIEPAGRLRKLRGIAARVGTSPAAYGTVSGLTRTMSFWITN